MSDFVRTTAGMAFSAALAVAGLMLLPAVAASAATATNLLPNGTFDGGTTSGWKAVNASLGVASPGADGSTYAAKVTRNTGTSYSMYAYPKPVTGAAAATQVQGSGEVLGISGRPLCLMLQEYTAGGSLVQTVKGCVTGSGAWQTLPTVTLTVKTAGDSVGFRVRQAKAVTGDSFKADSLSLTEVTPPPPPPPPSGVVAQWNMDEPAGSTTMIDSSGNGTNGTLKNGVQAGVPGETGTAYLFSGQSYVDVPSSNSLNPGTARVDISFWLNTTHLPTSGDYDLVRKGVYPDQEYKTELLQSGQIACAFTGSMGTVTAIGGPSLADGAWHHVECVKTDTQVQLTIDGTVAATTSGSAGSISTSGDATLGAHPGYDYYQGMLDDVTLTFG
jgi:Concanavalin A-like lectin/glucanases superfamily